MYENRISPFRLSSKISEFDGALTEDTVSTIQEQRQSILPGENVFGYSHGTRWRTRTTENDIENEDGEMQIHSSEISIPFQEIVDNDLGVLSRYRNSVASGLMQEFMRSMYQTISDSTDRTGNIVDAKGGGFKAEQFIEMLEMIEFGVGRDGKVSLPEIHAGPGLAEKMFQELSAQGPEFEERVQEIIQRKAEAALAKEKGRKSRFPKFEDE